MAAAKRFEELIAWQLAAEFMYWAYAASDAGPMLADPGFRDQWRDAAGSAPRNLAEGFVKYNPREFARYANIAKGSLGELQNHMLHAKALGYLSERQYLEGWRLLGRAFRATNRLHRYLRTCRNR